MNSGLYKKLAQQKKKEEEISSDSNAWQNVDLDTKIERLHAITKTSLIALRKIDEHLELLTKSASAHKHKTNEKGSYTDMPVTVSNEYDNINRALIPSLYQTTILSGLNLPDEDSTEI